MINMYESALNQKKEEIAASNQELMRLHLPKKIPAKKPTIINIYLF